MKVKMGRLLEAKRDQEDALAMSRQSGDRRVESNCLHNLCWTYVHLGDMKTAREVMAKAQEIRKGSDPEELPIGILSNAKLSLIEGNLKGAEAEYQSSIENNRDIGAEAREVALDLLLANGKFAEAEALGKQLLESYKKHANSAGQCRVVIALARVLAAQQKRTEAARILGEISHLLNKVEAFVRLKCALYQANFSGESDKSPVRMQKLLLLKEKLQKTEFVDLQLEATLLLGKAESDSGHKKEAAALLLSLHQVASDKGFGWIAAQTADLPQRLEPNAAPASRRN